MTTPRQLEVLSAISRLTAERGFPPSYAELMAVPGVRGKANVHRMVHLLIEQGLLMKGRGRSRNLIVLDTPVSQAGKIQRDTILSAMLRRIEDLDPPIASYDMDRIERLIFNMMKEDLPYAGEPKAVEPSSQDDYSEC